MENIRSLYINSPEFVRNILHLHFFNTTIYYESKMDPSKLEISGQLNLHLRMMRYATSFTFENGNYNFEMKKGGMLGIPSAIRFPLLFNLIINQCSSSKDIDDMFYKLYNSENANLVQLAEQFKNKDIGQCRELYDFIKRKECNTELTWQISEIQTGTWNYTLLALNNTFWETAFDSEHLSSLFQEEKEELDSIQEGNLNEDGYNEYIDRVNKLIDQKLT